MGWFYGFKLYLFINHFFEIISLRVTLGNTNDRTPIPDLCQKHTGRLYADKGYIGNKLSEKLAGSDIDFVTTLCKNMKAKAISLFDRVTLSKRYIIEAINDHL